MNCEEEITTESPYLYGLNRFRPVIEEGKNIQMEMDVNGMFIRFEDVSTRFNISTISFMEFGVSRLNFSLNDKGSLNIARENDGEFLFLPDFMKYLNKKWVEEHKNLSSF